MMKLISFIFVIEHRQGRQCFCVTSSAECNCFLPYHIMLFSNALTILEMLKAKEKDKKIQKEKGLEQAIISSGREIRTKNLFNYWSIFTFTFGLLTSICVAFHQSPLSFLQTWIIFSSSFLRKSEEDFKTNRLNYRATFKQVANPSQSNILRHVYDTYQLQ